MASKKVPKAVTPAQAGVQKCLMFLDSRLRGNDENGGFLAFYETINLDELAKNPNIDGFVKRSRSRRANSEE